MSGFVGYVGSPGDDASAAAVQAAIDQQPYGVPGSVLDFVWQHEAGGAAGTSQETGYNYAGYGGFFGLPISSLGSLGVVQQVNEAARLLAIQFATFGNWRDAISAYNVGPHGDFSQSYGQEYGGGGGLNASTVTTPASGGGGSSVAAAGGSSFSGGSDFGSLLALGGAALLGLLAIGPVINIVEAL